ncbi:Ephrin type-A receptor 5 [Desmophyllum pertusum]|uniref:Ephrin type-A receptor 5 n=1 Tax=Desmophyllum pertusum TaxID=174260 RepID=A0A9W9ZDZ3_9CNID|nr:Ephrin type-A receptor 5 [Desmophyllum pertusum]
MILQGSVCVKAGWRKLFRNAKCVHSVISKTSLVTPNVPNAQEKASQILQIGKAVNAIENSFARRRKTFQTIATGRPSAPRHLQNLLTNQTTVSLTWAHSHHRGRTDLFYEIECKILCRKTNKVAVKIVDRKCSSFHAKETCLTRVVVTNLFSRTAYRFKVYAKNGVSAVAEKEGFPSRFAKLDVTTLESAPEQPMVTVKRIDSTSVTVSWILKNGNGGILYFLVTYRKLEDGSDEHTINTTENEIIITGLDPGVEYEFVVVAKNSMGLGPSSEKAKNGRQQNRI